MFTKYPKKATYTDSEIVIGLVYATGTNAKTVIEHIIDRLKIANYEHEIIDISGDIIPLFGTDKPPTGKFKRTSHLMDCGNQIRKESGNNALLAVAVTAAIDRKREKNDEIPAKAVPSEKKAFIIKSLKSKEEVKLLRDVYGNGFYLIGIYQERESRKQTLVEKNMSEEEAIELLDRDEGEEFGYGQHTRDTFQLSDFFVSVDNNPAKTKSSIYRIIELLFGNPFLTPTFDEYAMFMAYCSSLRSADLSRQIGAVICKDNEILASGVNDCPKFGGGLYWAYFDENSNKYKDEDGRDHMLGYDSNKREFEKIANQIFEKFDINNNEENLKELKKTQIGDITEYGRVVHAEMEAIAMCARNNISCKGATLYATTFPCHNCAKHIIASGINKVVYIEPYPKSKALDFYKDSITEDPDEKNKVKFVPFFGIGPRKFIQMFSVTYGTLNDKIRKYQDGQKKEWELKKSSLRDQMLPSSYLERETNNATIFNKYLLENKELKTFTE